MLRSLNVETGQPKSKSFVPTEKEKADFSANELEYIERAQRDDLVYRVNMQAREKALAAAAAELARGK